MMASSSSTLLFICVTFLLTASIASSVIPEFNYKEIEKWGGVCGSGKRQSPVDINTSQVVLNKTLQPLTRNYHVYNATLTSDGIEVEVVFNVRGGLIIDGKTYDLKQMHWHSPSEHHFNGVQYAAELHQVHVAADGSRAVVGILLKYGPPSPVLTMLKPQLDELAKKPCGDEEQRIPIPTFESSFLSKRPSQYYRYLGSLTTPPCTENAIWNVLSKVKTISKDQVAALKAPLCKDNKNNARPTQSLNGRNVQKYDAN